MRSLRPRPCVSARRSALDGLENVQHRVSPVQRTFARRLSFWVILLGVICLPASVNAQLRADSARQDIRRLAGDIWSVWTAPVHMKDDDLRGLAAAVALTGVG